jgi:NAD(P)-dependent dehydrogenase (short-subunit alcohol dehydrogenase family)
METEAIETMSINFFGTLNVSNALFPLLRPNSRVVNVSSRLGLLTQVDNKEIKSKIKHESLTTEEVVQIVNDYIE